MPHKKGRARDVVPHREHRTSKKAVGGSSFSPLIAPTRASIAWALDRDFELDRDLPLPAELWLRALTCLDVLEVCHCEKASKALWGNLTRESSLWQKLCTLHFPSMYSSVCANPLGCPLLSNLPTDAQADETPDETEGLPTPVAIDWKMLFARRWQKQRKWERDRSGRPAALAARRCLACGELCEGNEDSEGCVIHPGDWLPLRPDDWNWTRVELQQLQSYARAAWRSLGGNAAIQRSARVYRGGGYWAKGLGFKGWGSKGHWAEGLGARPGPGNLRICIIGHIPCRWACCGAEDLISEGCASGPHRFR